MSDLSGSNWTEIDAGNSTTPPLGWPEGQMPSTVNDCARMMMGALKRMWNRINGVVTTTGGGYTYTTANTTYPSAYVTGETYRFKAHRTSTGNDAMQVNSLAAKPLYKRSSGGAVAIGAGDIVAGDMVSVTYDGSLNASAGGFWCGDNIGSLQKTDATVTYVNKSGDTINNYLNVTGPISATGQVNSTGGSAGYSFTSRDNSGQQWLWYADANTAHLWMNGGIKMNVDSNGNGNLPGSWATNGNQVVLNNNGVSYFGSNAIGFTWNGSVQVWVDHNLQGRISIADNSNNLTVNNITATGQCSIGGIQWFADSGFMRCNSALKVAGIVPTADNTQSCGLGGGQGWAQVASYWFNQLSDASLKRDVREPPVGALAQVHALSPIEFHWRDTEAEAMPYHRGFLAQRVREVMGEDFAGCTKHEDGTHGLAFNELVAVLWQAVRELSDEVAAMKAAK